MDATFLAKIRSDFPDYRFVDGARFSFRPPKTIVVGPEEANDSLLLLHELGHALSGHRDFNTSVKRVKMEREAWDKARELAADYGVEFDEDLVEDELDTYRDWLHKKTVCPKCGLTRFQTPDGNYHCPRCENF
ncbi:hypothetical protein IKW75_02120 [Candidatus Saccharibacteria bacterium]|nr:hypothetical protein [Candidatus Saccharibacteria bacterium]